MNLWEMFVEWCGKRIANNWNELKEALIIFGNTIETITDSIVKFIRK